MLVVYGRGQSAKLLARGLDGLWYSSDSDRLREWRGGRWLRLRRHPYASHIVNYGHTAAHGDARHVLNGTIISNKYSQLERMGRANVTVPNHRTTRPNEPGWLCRAFQHQRGTDIQRGTEHLRRTRREVECVCRECNNQHTRVAETAEAVVNYPRADYYVAYIPKEREFRVHIIKGQSVRMCEKIPQDRRATIWNSGNSHFSFADVQPGEVRRSIRQVAKDAVEALGMDFGAVDIMWHRGHAYVLEVNSAPSLTDNDNTLERYVEHIRRWENGRTAQADRGRGRRNR